MRPAGGGSTGGGHQTLSTGLTVLMANTPLSLKSLTPERKYFADGKSGSLGWKRMSRTRAAILEMACRFDTRSRMGTPLFCTGRKNQTVGVIILSISFSSLWATSQPIGLRDGYRLRTVNRRAFGISKRPDALAIWCLNFCFTLFTCGSSRSPLTPTNENAG